MYKRDIPTRSRSKAADARRKSAGKIRDFTAEILGNAGAGTGDNRLYKLTFSAPAMPEPRPFQFVMLAPAPVRKARARRGLLKTLRNALDLRPGPFLNRPFGIHRAFRSGKTEPAHREPGAETRRPDRFEILYKVVPGGLGTPLMAELKRGDKVRMLGPLGKPFDISELTASGIKEVHVIGGGVGMAPLVFLVQTVLRAGFPVKAFIGIAAMRDIACSDDPALSFDESPRNAYFFIDDLIASGMRPRDIYLSCDKTAPAGAACGIPKANFFHGVVSSQYAEFLRRRSNAGCMAFACGPEIMMEKTWRAARTAGVRLKVLMENRMACGIGVCLSCVCAMRGGDYRAVCVEGPVFDAGEIAWNRNIC